MKVFVTGGTGLVGSNVIKVAREKYGAHYKVVAGDLQEQDDLRVLDWDGHHVFSSFSIKDLGKPIYYEP